MKIKLVILYFFLSITGYSQKAYDFFGAIKLNDTTFISYKLVFNENKGVIDGFSITDLGGEHETKSDIYGTYSHQRNELNFSEKGIIYTKSPVIQEDFCFIHFKSNAFDLGKSKNLKGNFIGKFSDNSECISGDIALTLAEKIEKRTKKISKKIMKTKRISDRIKTKIDPIKLLDTLNMNILRKNQVLSVFSKSKEIDLVIFDGEKQDGDRVSILIDNNLILNNYEITNKKKIIPIFIKNAKVSIKIKALTSGTIPPNTMNVKLIEDGRTIDVISTLQKGEQAQIDLLFKDKK